MKNDLYKIFKKKRGIVIGALHVPPLLGYPKFPGFKTALTNALTDLRALEKGGIDGIIFENNYDIPHKAIVDSPVVASMTFLGEKLRGATKLPMGVSILWNDYRAALSIAKTLGLQFIRIPVFVDTVETDYGVIQGTPSDVLKFRKEIGAENVALFTDIHVKHSKLLSKKSLVQSARAAIKGGSSGIIITGTWTGDAPDITSLRTLRTALPLCPILIGSGATAQNANALHSFANGFIVSTSLKEGATKPRERNVKSYEQRIAPDKVRNFTITARRAEMS